MTASGIIGITTGFTCLGALAGAMHLKLLAWNISALLGGLNRFKACVASLGRSVVTIAVFAFAASHSAPALIATLAGFLLTRAVFVGRPDILLP